MEITLDQTLQKGIEAHKGGQVQEADHYYTAILKSQPNHPDANHNMGILAVGVGKVEAALPFFKTALEANPKIEQFWLSYINALVKLDRLTDAKTMFDKAKSNGAKGDGFDRLEEQLRSSPFQNSNAQDLPKEQLQSLVNLYKQKKLQQVFEEAQILTKRYTKSLALWNLMGASAAQIGELDEAVVAFQKVISIDPKNALALNNMGNAFRKQDKLDEAIKAYNKALSLNPDLTQAYYNMGIALKNHGKLDEAIKAYNKAISLKPDYTEAYNNLGVALQDQGKLDEAIKAYNKAISLNPDYTKAYNNMGIAFRDQGKLDEAIKALSKAISLNPDYDEAYNNMGNAFRDQGKLEDAIEAYNKSISINPDYDEAYNNLGVALQDQGKLDEAIKAYNKALSLNPDFAEAWNNLGITLEEQGKLGEAIEVYNKALSINPDYAEAYNNMGNVLKGKGNLEEAIEAYTKALSIKPDYAETYNNLGNALKDQHKLGEAMSAYNKALSINPDYAEAYNNMGNVLKGKGNLEEAIEAYTKALSIKPDISHVHNNIGNALEDQLKSDEAVASFQKAFEFRSGIVPKYDKALAPGTTGLFFELTNKCNFHCVFCPSDSQKRNLGSMNLELVKRLYTEASEKKLASFVNLHLMGEPTLHPKLIEILDFGASKNIKTDLVTNGSTLVAKIVPQILDSLYGTITASHMTPSKETYHFRGKVGLSWERYISNLRLLVREYMKRSAQGKICKNDITIRVMSTMNTAANCTITENTDEARAILKEWTDFVTSIEEELGMDPFERVDYTSHDLLKENSSPSIDYPLQKGVKLTFWRAFTFANTRLSDEYKLEDRGETAYCSHPFKDVGVLWNGDVTLCCLDHDGELSVGNITNSSIEEIIQNDEAKKLRASMLGRCSLPSVCKTCQARPVKRQNADKVNPAIN